jgi:hypothetical protein
MVVMQDNLEMMVGKQYGIHLEGLLHRKMLVLLELVEQQEMVEVVVLKVVVQEVGALGLLVEIQEMLVILAILGQVLVEVVVVVLVVEILFQRVLHCLQFKQGMEHLEMPQEEVVVEVQEAIREPTMQAIHFQVVVEEVEEVPVLLVEQAQQILEFLEHLQMQIKMLLQELQVY